MAQERALIVWLTYDDKLAIYQSRYPVYAEPLQKLRSESRLACPEY